MWIIVSSHGQQHTVDVDKDESMEDLKFRLEELTGVLVEDQKLVYKGSTRISQETSTGMSIEKAGITDGLKIMLLGPLTAEKSAVAKGDRRLAILQKRAEAVPKVARATKTGSMDLNSLKYSFHRIEPLRHPIIQALNRPGLSTEAATTFLHRLAEDPAIKGLMSKHGLSGDLLTELPPLPDDPETSARLLGLNKVDGNGRTILLRLRTDDLEGWRNYIGVRETLIHELVHNTIGPHNDDFHALNRKYLLEVEGVDRAEKQARTQKTGGASSSSQWSESSVTDRYAPAAVPDKGHQNRLGSAFGNTEEDDSPEVRRQRIREAAEGRISRGEADTVLKCGTAPPDEASKRRS